MKKLEPKHQKLVRQEFLNVDRKELQGALNTSASYVRQIVGGFVQVSPKKAKQIQKATNGRVRAKILRPDVFDGEPV